MGILDKIKNKVTDRKGSSAKDEDKKKEVKKITSDDKNKGVVKKDVKKEVKKTDKKKDIKKIKGSAYRVLVKPLITEKVTELGELNKYGFEVSVKTNKTEIAKAIKEVYGVTPISVNIINMRGKRVRFGRTMGKKKDWKKAIITLKKGEKIEVYQGV